MKYNRSSLRWTLTVLIAVVLLVTVGYYTGVILEKKPEADTAMVQKVSDVNDTDEEEAVDDGQVLFNPTEEDGSEARITAGKLSNAIQVEKGSVNVLILGQDKSSNMYDTICIASIDKANRKMKLIMIPRDTYVEYDKQVVDVLRQKGRSKTAGVYKINNAHNIGKLVKYEGRFSPGYISFVADVIKEKFGVAIDDFVKINTEGFAKLVDQFGGVKIDVPYNMDYEDPTQDLYIHLNKGKQRLDGSQAEGFVRFRQGYKEDGTFFNIGDIARKENQVVFMKEFIRQHGSIRNINKLPDVINLLDKYLDTSIGVGDGIFNYLGIAREIISNKYDVDSQILDGKQIRIDGAAYIDIE